jgi:hypothetical protein
MSTPKVSDAAAAPENAGAEQVKLPESAPATNGTKKTLIQKLCEVGKELTWVEKRGENKFHGYKYATEADLVMAIRLELYDRHVFLVPNVLSTVREDITAKDDPKAKRKAITDMVIEWTWVDGDTGEKLVCHMPGCGEDASDKGTYKAITGSEKYLLLKTFLIPTYDDAESLTAEDKKALQLRIVEEKGAELKAKKEAREAPNEEEAARILKKGEVLFIDLPDRFNGEALAVYGKPIMAEDMISFFNDCAAKRFKGPEGVFYKLEVQYGRDCKAMAEKKGYTVKGNFEN